MVVNTLLKVLEQLLHKIKANRRREMVVISHGGDVPNQGSRINFRLQRISDACFVALHGKGVSGDRQTASLTALVENMHL